MEGEVIEGTKNVLTTRVVKKQISLLSRQARKFKEREREREIESRVNEILIGVHSAITGVVGITVFASLFVFFEERKWIDTRWLFCGLLGFAFMVGVVVYAPLVGLRSQMLNYAMNGNSLEIRKHFGEYFSRVFGRQNKEKTPADDARPQIGLASIRSTKAHPLALAERIGEH